MLTSVLYRLYERRLLAEIRRQPLPRHIGLILDGNRRFARQLGLAEIIQGHERGAAKLEEALEWCVELGIRMVTIWILSTENLMRPPEELEGLLSLTWPLGMAGARRWWMPSRASCAIGAARG